MVIDTAIKKGYKQTEICVIPEDWKIFTATQVCDLVVDCKNRTPPVVEASDYAVVRTPNVRNGKFVREELRFTDEQSFRKWTTRAIPQIGDILITREAPLGEVCLVPSEVRVCLGQRMMLYRPNKEKADSRFLLYALMSSGVQSNLMKKIGGSTVGHAKVDDIRFLQLPLPPSKAEQESIATVLSDTDALIERLEKLIDKKKAIKQGTMQQLLTGKKRLPGFSGKWDIQDLDSISDVIDPHPSHRAPVESLNGIPFVGIGDLLESGELSNVNYRTVSEEIYAEHRNRYHFEDGLIGLGRVASIGKVVKLKNKSFKYTISPTLGVIKPLKINADLLYYLLCSKSIKDQFSKIMSGSTRSSVGMIVLRKLKIYFPIDPNEQSAIATVLSDMDAEIESLEYKRDKYIMIRQGMMQQLLTGRIRIYAKN